jgi:hypothetical protein
LAIYVAPEYEGDKSSSANVRMSGMVEIVELQPGELSDHDALKQIRARINEDSRRLKFPSHWRKREKPSGITQR